MSRFMLLRLLRGHIGSGREERGKGNITGVGGRGSQHFNRHPNV